MADSKSSSYGIGFGCALAMTISWSLHHSILWAVSHGLCGWVYIIYFAMTRPA